MLVVYTIPLLEQVAKVERVVDSSTQRIVRVPVDADQEGSYSHSTSSTVGALRHKHSIAGKTGAAGAGDEWSKGKRGEHGGSPPRIVTQCPSG
ncbi:MAG: hypothetical protein AVDCRST_MAG26-2042 [uncultured Chloroflexia bacterium]|uniref:Uncharacterized protein n=1 Tax=uncultured Chloroflexia bacterium TaxID=1672391 RepID=A0A6J4IMU0_9CHLR|nr:MAG: hypothetical protein AVDCRST_MAG26-2042 [uncultured Chloroflexia bacterium]